MAVRSLSRKVIKAVRPGVRGKGVNQHWSKTVDVKSLKSAISISMVKGLARFSLEQFLPWEKMRVKEFNTGPVAQDFLIPVKSWDCFQVRFFIFFFTF